MLTQLRIQNFKSWRDTGQMRFASLTGFFGANSSGKTSILQFLTTLPNFPSIRRSPILTAQTANLSLLRLPIPKNHRFSMRRTQIGGTILLF